MSCTTDEFRFYAAYRQIYVFDSARDAGGEDMVFTDQTLRDHFTAANGCVVLGTESYGEVKVIVEIHNRVASEPDLDITKWDHVVEGGIDFTSNWLLITDNEGQSGRCFRITGPGHYRIRFCGANFAAAVDSDIGGDWYLIQVWPGQPIPVHVLKQGCGPYTPR